MPHTAYLSLGSNIGDRVANLRDAVQRLSALGVIVGRSSIYETEPMEVVDQPWFLNAAVTLRTELPPQELLRGILAIECAMGRERTQPKGPRNIDIDIVLYDDLVIHEPGLTIPHPAMQQRLFVLQPLSQIGTSVTHPTLHRTIGQLRDELTPLKQRIRRIDAPWSNDD